MFARWCKRGIRPNSTQLLSRVGVIDVNWLYHFVTVEIDYDPKGKSEKAKRFTKFICCIAGL